MKKLQMILLCLMIMSSLFTQTVLTITAQTLDIESIENQSIQLLSSDTGQVLYNEQSQELVEMNAITHLLVVYLVFEAIEQGDISLSTVVPISNAAYQLSQDYTIDNVPLRQDYEYTVEELLSIVALKNANGAVVALSELLAFSQDECIQLIEQLLKKWHVNSVTLYNVTGIAINQEQWNTIAAYDVGVIVYHLLHDFPQWVEYTKVESLVFKEETDDAIPLETDNPYLANQSESDLAKSDGLLFAVTQDELQHHIVTAQVDEVRLIAIVLGTDELQKQPGKLLLNYGFSTYQSYDVMVKGEKTEQLPLIEVSGGSSQTLQTIYGETLSLLVPIGQHSHKYRYHFTPIADKFNHTNQVLAPIQQGEVVGYMSVEAESTEDQLVLIDSEAMIVEVIAAQEVTESPFYIKWWQSISRIVRIVQEQVRKFFINLFNE